MSSHRAIIHVDMDAFYASIEQRDDPSLRGKPVIVGGRSMRSVVCTASYEARPFGVRSAMPMVEAMRRCPQAIVVPPRMERYAGVSHTIMEILQRFSPLIEPLSLDEAFLDVTESKALFGDGASIARQIRLLIAEETALTASAGVASSKFVAKIASDMNKPDGLTLVPAGGEAGFLAPLPVGRMWGVGPKAGEKLGRLGLKSIGDLARSTPEIVGRALGSTWGEYIVGLARGLDERPVVPDREARSIGAEDTFETDLVEREDLELAILSQAVRVAARLTHKRLRAKTIVLKLKLRDHTLLSRRVTLDAAVADTMSVYRAACGLLDRFALPGAAIRLTGVAAAGLSAVDGGQGSLFRDEAAERRNKLERTLEDVRARFGSAAVTQAGLRAFEQGSTKAERAGKRRSD
jgi:DNA polymerase IV